jgi:hypothetical protein
MPKCKNCKIPFEARYPMQSCCSAICAIQYAKDNPKLVKKVERDSFNSWKKEVREKHKNAAHYRKELQVIFNTYIRLRDEGKPCISCGRNLAGRKVDASHFFSTGSYPNLRFDENNVHSACIPCNQHKGGNLIEYAIRLPERIGQEAYENLVNSRSTELKLTIPELIEKIEYYKKLIKQMSQPR